MIVSIAAVISLDAKLTRHAETAVGDWASREDNEHFRQLIAEHEVLVMGRGTYETTKHDLKHDKKRLRVVLTSHQDWFADQAIEGQLEFHDETPSHLVERLGEMGYKNLLVVGGPLMITDFIKNNLAHYLYVTVEPHLFGQGVPLVTSEPIDPKLEFVSSRQLNDKGSLLLTYKINRQ